MDYTSVLFLFTIWFFKKRFIGLVLTIFFIKYATMQMSFNMINISTYYQIVTNFNTKNNIFIMLLIVILLIYNLNKTVSYVNIHYTLLYLWYINNIVVEYTLQSWMFIYTNKNELNTNLINGIMLVHPPILYSFYAIIILFITLPYWNSGRKHSLGSNKGVFYVTELQLTLNKVVIAIYIAIILGCWWAEQELSWGGWWSWDFVELIALNIFLCKLYFIHKNSANVVTGFREIQLKKLIWLFIVIVSITPVRYNIINSIHNFIDIQSQNQYVDYLYILISFVLFSTLIRFFIKTYMGLENTNLCAFFLYMCFYVVVIAFLLIYLYILCDTKTKFMFSYNPTIVYKALLQYSVFFIIFWFLVVIFKIGHISSKTNLIIFYCCIFIFCFYNTCFIAILLLFNVLSGFNKLIQTHSLLSPQIKNNTAFIILHSLLIIYLHTTTNQLYLFFGEVLTLTLDRLPLIKINTQQDTVFLQNVVDSNAEFFFLIDNYLLKNNFFYLGDYSNNLYKDIFEKKMCFGSFFLYETFSYNLQTLIQPIGFSISLIFFLILFLIKFGFQKKIIKKYLF